uniref:RNA-binding protein 34 n=1 Tax=Parastrongyloides trichosuri TaxID=131310 RepID=A0A0N4ZRG5_PARTI
MSKKYKPGNLASALFGVNNDNIESDSESDSSVKNEPDTPTTMVVTSNKAEELAKEEKHNSRMEHKKKILKKIETVKQRDEECPRTLFIGNAPLTATRDRIRNIFNHYGKVESVRIRNVHPENEKMSRRAAAQTRKYSEEQKNLNFYVKYEKEESVAAAIAAGKKEMDGNRLIITAADDNKYESNCSVFVGNLPHKITENEVIKHFEKVGEVNAVRVVRNRDTHEGLGIGFVRYQDPSSVEKALELNGKKLKNKELRVTKILKKKNRPVKSNDNNKFNKKGKFNNKGKKFEDKNKNGLLPRSKKITKQIKKRENKSKKNSIMS